MLEDVAPPVPAPAGAVEYPTSDGKPMGESDLHRDQMVDLILALQQFYRDDPRVYATGNLVFYYEEGNRRRHLSPDVMVVFGVPQGRRLVYKLWEEGKAPSLVIEVTSRTTRREDLGKKKQLYERFGVEEYVLFDPTGDYLEPRLQIHRLTGDGYRRAPAEDDLLRTVGLRAVVVDGWLRLQEPATGRLLPTPREAEARAAEQAARAAEQAARADREAEARRRLEREVAELRARLEDAR